ncbi:hypothetical protein MKW94_003859, partial [Papaver nudicaule]|nr:hypothetical protein [Papaver nudicaule]
LWISLKVFQRQEAAAQEGFTSGFKESVSVGYKWGVVCGISSALACLPDGLKEKLVESLEAREKFQMFTHLSVPFPRKMLLVYNTSNSETLSSYHISRCSRLRGYSEELEFLRQSSAVQVHSAFIIILICYIMQGLLNSKYCVSEFLLQ